MTLTLGLQPRQGHGKVRAENVIWESHSHFWVCERVWRIEPTHSQVDSHFENLSLYGVPNLQKVIWKEKNSLDWTFIYSIGNLLKLKCLKWACTIHLNTYNTSYGQKKGRLNPFFDLLKQICKIILRLVETNLLQFQTPTVATWQKPLSRFSPNLANLSLCQHFLLWFFSFFYRFRTYMRKELHANKKR
jgi:hypothetical protein